jgi:hypothetical protein
MSEITVYYEESIIYQKHPDLRLQREYDLFNVSNCYVIFKTMKYYFESIQFDKDGKYMYIVHKNSDLSKSFFFQIEMSSTDSPDPEKNVSKTEYKDFLKNFDPKASTTGSTPKTSLNLRGFITDVFKDPKDVKLKRDKTDSKAKNWVVKVDKTLIVYEPIRAPEMASIDIAKFNPEPEDNNATNKNTITFEKKRGGTVQNCVRKGYYGDKVKSQDIIDTSDKTAETRKALSITALVLFFVLVFGVIIVHLYKKSPDTDFFGYRLPEMEGGASKMMGGACSIPGLESVQFQPPKPSILGYFKFSAFLLFLNLMIFGGNPVREHKITHKPPPQRSIEDHTKDRQAFIGVGITIMVIGFIVALVYKSQEKKILGGMDVLSLLLYSPKSIAIYPAILAYLVFYTHFIKLAQNDVELPEFLLFMLSFILLSGYAMYASYSDATSFRSGPFIVLVVLLVIILMSIGPIIIKDLADKKKKEEGTA